MTTNVTITPHPGDGVEVLVVLTDSGKKSVPEEHVLQNNEAPFTISVYDNCVVTVYERKKE